MSNLQGSFFGDEGELGVAFGNGGVERGKFAATLSSAHGNEKFVRKISNASTTALGIVVWFIAVSLDVMLMQDFYR